MTNISSRTGPPPDTIVDSAVPVPDFASFVDQWNTVQGRGTPQLHDRIAGWLADRWADKDPRLLLMVFRDAGKSTLVGLYAAWLLCRNPDLRIMVVSAEHRLATKMTRNIRTILELHPRAGHVLPNKGRDQWASDSFTVQRSLAQRDPSVLGRGIQGNLTGSRADVIICDDVEVPNTADTAEKRRDLRERLAELNFILVSDGTQIFVGTPHSYYSIYADQPRAEASEERPLLAGYTRLVVPVRDAHGISAWPERFTDEVIERMKSDVGPARFRSQMMLTPTHNRDIRLDPQRLRRYSGEFEVTYAADQMQLHIEGNRMVGSCCWWDPAYGRPGTGDASVVACVFTDRESRYWLHDIAYMTFDPTKLDETDEATQLCRQALSFAMRNEQRSLFIENNGLGRFLPGLAKREAKLGGMPVQVREERSSKSKTARILDVFDVVLAAGKLHVHERVLASPFVEEMREWTPDGGARDDGLDAVAACLAMQKVYMHTSAPAVRRPDWRGYGVPLTAQAEFRIF